MILLRRRQVLLAMAAGAVLLAAMPLAAEPPANVPVIEIREAADSITRALSGEIKAREEIGLSFPRGGRILRIDVREGDRVEKGQELARLESVQQEQALHEAESEVEAARADLRRAEEEFQRQEALLARGATTRIRRDEAERRYHIAQANMERASANLTRARKFYEDTFLRAAASGVITRRLDDPGEVVAGAGPVLMLASGEALDAVFDAPEALPVFLGSDFVVRLALIDRPAVRFTGHLREISPLVDPGKGTVEVKVGVDGRPEGVHYGDAVRGTVTLPMPAHVAIPATALVAAGEGAAVWKVMALEDAPELGEAVLQPVKIARHEDGRIILETGLADGDLIVAAGAQLMYPGRLVRLAGSGATAKGAGE